MSGAAFFALSASGPAFVATVQSPYDVTTGSTTAQVDVPVVITGGVGPFTYDWVASTLDPSISIINSTSNPVTVRAFGLSVGNTKSCDLYVIVTDTASGVSAASNASLIFFTRV